MSRKILKNYEKIFKITLTYHPLSRLDFDDLPIDWCQMQADAFGEKGIEPCSENTLKNFAKTAKIKKANSFNFFRGFNDDLTVIDLYNVNYIF